MVVNEYVDGPFTLSYAGEKRGPASSKVYEDVQKACTDAKKLFDKEPSGVAVRVMGIQRIFGFMVPVHAAIFKE